MTPAERRDYWEDRITRCCPRIGTFAIRTDNSVDLSGRFDVHQLRELVDALEALETEDPP